MMKSNEIKLTNSLSCAVEAIQEVERACREAGLEGEQVNRMRLLTEEAIAMTTDILTSCRGTLWMEWEGGECQLHLTAVAPMDEAEKAAWCHHQAKTRYDALEAAGVDPKKQPDGTSLTEEETMKVMEQEQEKYYLPNVIYCYFCEKDGFSVTEEDMEEMVR